MRISLAFLAALACGPAIAAPPPAIEKPEMAIAYRQSVYRMIRWNFAPMGDMVRGKRAWDGAAFAQHASRVAWLAQQLEEGYPVGSDRGAITDAKPEIWANWDDFLVKAKAANDAAGALDVSSAEAIGAGMGALGGACKDCHTTYRMAKE